MNKPIFIKRTGEEWGRPVRWGTMPVGDIFVPVPRGWYYREGDRLIIALKIRKGVFTPSAKYSYWVNERVRLGCALPNYV